MLPIWTGEVVGTMHIYGITTKELAGRMGIDCTYLSALLHDRRKTATSQQRILETLQAMIIERTQAHEDY